VSASLGKQTLKPRGKIALRRPANAGGWRLAVAALAFVAFALQSYVTQTHIHGAFVSSDVAKISKQVAGKAPGEPHDKYPANDDPANCPICQEILHAGQYVAPGAIVFALPVETIAVIPLSLDAPLIVKAIPLGWRGRAPPHA